VYDGDGVRMSDCMFDGQVANATDPVLALVAADRRTTLIAMPKRGATRSTRLTSACRQRWPRRVA
jgi:hypothetical protein